MGLSTCEERNILSDGVFYRSKNMPPRVFPVVRRSILARLWKSDPFIFWFGSWGTHFVSRGIHFVFSNSISLIAGPVSVRRISLVVDCRVRGFFSDNLLAMTIHFRDWHIIFPHSLTLIVFGEIITSQAPLLITAKFSPSIITKQKSPPERFRKHLLI